MKIAEALTARADLQRRIEQLRARIVANARYQEGKEPAEGAASLLGDMTDALAARDVLRLQHSLLVDAAADGVAQELRELDNRIQQANWTHDLEE